MNNIKLNVDKNVVIADVGSNWKDINDSINRCKADKKRVEYEKTIQISEDIPPTME